MRKYILSFLLLSMVQLISCLDKDNSTASDDSGNNLIYFSSFEKENDLSLWTGLNKEELKDEAAPGGGMKSILVGGGCLQPAATLKIPVTVTGKYSFDCWAKAADSISSGLIKMGKSALDSDKEKVMVRITGMNWKHYLSDALRLEKGDTLFIELYVGGIVPNSIYLDKFKIEILK